MTPDPEQVEAHAAQGYSLPDVARLLGVPFFNQNSPESNAAIDAFNRGAARWRDNGAPIPPRATDIIAQAVHSQLLSKEMTRPQLKEALGFRHDDLNLAVETLEAQILIEHREDGMGTLFYRGAGTPAAKPERVAAPVTRETDPQPLAENNDVHETSQPKPNSNGNSDIVGNKPGKISARPEASVLEAREADSRRGPTYKPLDLIEVENLMATEETMAMAAEKLGLTTSQLSVRRQKDDAVAAAVDRGRRRYYDSLEPNAETDDAESPESEKIITKPITTKPPCGCGRPGTHVGRRAFRRARAGGDFPAKKQDPALPVSSTALVEPKQAMAQVQVMGGVKMHNEIEVRVSEMANWPADRVSEFFDALAKVIEIPQRPTPKTIKRAWSKDFEDDDAHGKGVPGMTMLFLVSLFHDGMEEHEKEAVFTLIRYLKRIQAANEAASETKKAANA